jgi:hypothetical protein
MIDKGKKADRVVGTRTARIAAEATAEHERQAQALQTRLRSLRDEIFVEVRRALTRLEKSGFPGGEMIRIQRSRLIGRQYEEKAAWTLEVPVICEGKTMARPVWLVSDGRLLANMAGWEVLDHEQDEPFLSAILEEMRRLGLDDRDAQFPGVP